MKSFEESGLLKKGVRKQLQMKQRILSMLIDPVGASLLGNLLRGKGMKAKILSRGVLRVGKGMIRAGQNL